MLAQRIRMRNERRRRSSLNCKLGSLASRATRKALVEERDVNPAQAAMVSLDRLVIFDSLCSMTGR
jgi:hypothetical protein